MPETSFAGFTGEDRLNLLDGVENTTIGLLKAMCDDYRLVARNSFTVDGKLREREWKKDDPAGYALWKRARKVIAAAEKSGESEFIQGVARQIKDGECRTCGKDGFEENPDCKTHDPYDLPNDEAVDTLHALIEEAREILEARV
jgi:hypothetical protein